MASLYKRDRSPYWWIKRVEAGRVIRESTQLLVASAQETKRARSKCALETSKELGTVTPKDSERWDNWADKFLETHCQHEPTLKGYRQSWTWVRSYLADIHVAIPRDLTYDHVFGYIAWRTSQDIERSTALRDIKVLRVLMRHAVRTGLAAGNPCDRLGVERPIPTPKPELNDKQIVTIYDALASESPWMGLAFSICLHTGCRISEANLERIDLDFTRKTITFRNPKGGTKRAFTTVLTAELKGIIKRATKAHDLVALIPPKTASQLFSKFFGKLKIKCSIHSTRVTFISRLARSGVPERIARLAVNHASEAVHRTYQRLQVDDVRQIEGAVKFPLPQSSSDTKNEIRDK